MMSLSTILSERKANNKKNIPTEKWTVMEHSTNDLKKQKLSNKAIKSGNLLPEFKLPNVHNKVISLNEITSDFLIISFYRGGWCPFCNLELKALQNILPDLKKMNTELVAISPETPDNSLTTSEKNELGFTVLSDLNNSYAKSLGLVFQLPEDLREVYHSFNIDVPKHNKNKDYELPMPATYILNKKREIIYDFIPEDYTERLNPSTILNILKKAQQ